MFLGANTGHNQFSLTVHNILDTVLVANDILRGWLNNTRANSKARHNINECIRCCVLKSLLDILLLTLFRFNLCCRTQNCVIVFHDLHNSVFVLYELKSYYSIARLPILFLQLECFLGGEATSLVSAMQVFALYLYLHYFCICIEFLFAFLLYLYYTAREGPLRNLSPWCSQTIVKY